MTEIYRFSPDFRRDDPKKLCFCAHCYRDIKDQSKAVPVTVDWNTWQAIEGHDNEKLFPNYPSKEIGNEYFGATCWKKIKAGEINNNDGREG